MSLVWGRIIGEVRKMRDDKYTLERIGGILGVAKPTVQRWLENEAGGEKTAFIDVLRYLKALDIDLKDLLFGDEQNARESALTAELEASGEEKLRLSLELSDSRSDLVNAQKDLLAARAKIIELQEKIIGLEKLNAEITDKARKAIIAAAASSKKTEASPPPPAAAPAAPDMTRTGKRRLDASRFPDLPPIHLQYGK